MTPILEIQNIIKDYPSVRAVDNVSLSIEQGTCFGLLGPNGAGKTTLLEIIEGVRKPGSGKILYKGQLKRSSFREEAGIQFQNTELPDFLTVKETLQTFRGMYSKSTPLKELIEMCQLQDICGNDNHKISGGQKQRLLLAIALANDPEMIFLDEPTTGLDPQARRHLWDIVTTIKSRNKTVFLTTHYMEEAQILCDRVAIMDLGKIIALGSPRDLISREKDKGVIILHDSIGTDRLNGLPWKIHTHQDTIEIHTEKINESIQELINRGFDLSGITVRPSNLEDLFLKLTGRKLRS